MARRQVLFLHGAGDEAFEADGGLADSLQRSLGPAYEVVYPAMPGIANARYVEAKQAIAAAIRELREPMILVAHALGGSILLKHLHESREPKQIAGIFLLAAPFWGEGGWQYDGGEEFELPEPLTLPEGTPVYLFYSKDDDTVSYDHLALYQRRLPRAQPRPQDTGGHQFANDLAAVASEIERLS